MMQAVVADLFGLPEQRVRVIAPDVGGSFGIKIHVYQDDMAACALALLLGRPVKFVATRHESFLSDIHAREQRIDVEVAAEADGTLTAIRAAITAPVGPVLRVSPLERGRGRAGAAPAARALPHPPLRGDARVLAQNKVVTSQYRAVGHPIAAAVTESMVDVVARDLGLDPADVRRRNWCAPRSCPTPPRRATSTTAAAIGPRSSGSSRRRATRRCDGSRRRRGRPVATWGSGSRASSS